MTFDLCIPAYNEADIIKETLERVCAALDELRSVEPFIEQPIEWNIIVSDNASTDGMREKVEALLNPRVKVIRIETKGKGAAILEAAHRSTSDYFGFIDADLSADPRDIVPLLKSILQDEADIVIGSRLLDTDIVKRGVLRSASSYAFNVFRRALLGIKVVDSQCGLKVMNAQGRTLLGSCVETGWFLDIEFLAKAERAGLRIREVPVHWNENQFSGRLSKLRVMRDGVGALSAMLRIRKQLRAAA